MYFSFFRLQAPLIEALWHEKEAAKTGALATVKLKIGGTSGGADFLLYRAGGCFTVPSVKAVWGLELKGKKGSGE